jgi:hypothetical protein
MVECLALRVLVHDPIDEGDVEIGVLGRAAGGHVRPPTLRQELLDRGVSNLEGQDRARVDVAADVLLGGERGPGREQ